MSVPPVERRDIQRYSPPSPVSVTVPGSSTTTVESAPSPSRFGYVGRPAVREGLGQSPARSESSERLAPPVPEVMVTEIVVSRDRKPQEIQPTDLPEGDSTAALMQAAKPGVGEVERVQRAVKIDGNTRVSGSADTIARVAHTREMTEADHVAIDEGLPFWTIVVGERDVSASNGESGRASIVDAGRLYDGLSTTFVDAHPSKNIGVEVHAVPVDEDTLQQMIWKLGADASYGKAYPNADPDPDVLSADFAGPAHETFQKGLSAGHRPETVFFLVGGRTAEESRQHAYDFAGSVFPSQMYPMSLRVIPDEAVSRAEALEQPIPLDPRILQFASEVGVMFRVPTIRELTGTPKIVKPEFSPNPPEVDSRGLTIVIGHEATNGKPIPLNVRNHFTVNGATEAGKTTLMLTILRETALARKRRKDAVTSKIVVGLEKEVPALPIAEVYKAAGIDEPVIKYALGETGTDHFPAALALFQTMEGLPLTDYAHGIITMYRMFFTISEQGKNAGSDSRGLTMLTQALQESIYSLLESKGYNVALNTTVFKAGEPAPFTLRELSDEMAKTMTRLESTESNDAGRWAKDVQAFYRTNIEGPAKGPAGEQLVGIGQIFDWKEAMRKGSTIAVDVTQVHQDYRALYTAVVFMKAHQALQVLNRERKPGELPYDGLGLVDEARGLVPDNATGSAFLTWLAISRSFDFAKQKSDEPEPGFGIGLLSQSPMLTGEGDNNIAARFALQTPPGEVQQTIGRDLGLSPEHTAYLGHMQSGEGIFWTKRRRSGGINNIIVSKAPRATGAQVEGPERFIRVRPAFKNKETAEVIDAAERYLASSWGKILIGYTLFENGFINNGLGFVLNNSKSKPIERRPDPYQTTVRGHDETEANQIANSIDAYLAQHVFDPELHDRVRTRIMESAANKVDLAIRRAILTAQLPADEFTASLPDLVAKSLGENPGGMGDGSLNLNKINPLALLTPIRMHLEDGLDPLDIGVEGSNPVAQRRTLELLVRQEVERRYRGLKGKLETSLRKTRNAERIDHIEGDDRDFAHVKGANAREELEYLAYLEEQAVLNPAIITGERWAQVAAQLQQINDWLDQAPPIVDVDGALYLSNWEKPYRARLPDMEIDFSGSSRGEQLRKVEKLDEAWRKRRNYPRVPLIDFFAPGPSGTNLLEEAIAGVMALQQAEGTIYEAPTVEQVSLQRLIESSTEAEWGLAADDFLQLMMMHPYASSQAQVLINQLIYNLINRHVVNKERSQR